MNEQTKKRSRTTGRQFMADEKLQIIAEARQPGTTLAEGPRCYQVDGAAFYRWEREARSAMLQAPAGRHRGGEGRIRELERENARLQAELVTKRRVTLRSGRGEPGAKKGGSKNEGIHPFLVGAKDELLVLVARTQERKPDRARVDWRRPNRELLQAAAWPLKEWNSEPLWIGAISSEAPHSLARCPAYSATRHMQQKYGALSTNARSSTPGRDRCGRQHVILGYHGQTIHHG